MRDEREDADDGGEREAGATPSSTGTGTEPQAVALKEQHDLEAFAIDRREPEEREAPPDSAADVSRISSVFRRLCIEIQPVQ